jgi:hypothetical protein
MARKIDGQKYLAVLVAENSNLQLHSVDGKNKSTDG